MLHLGHVLKLYCNNLTRKMDPEDVPKRVLPRSRVLAWEMLCYPPGEGIAPLTPSCRAGKVLLGVFLSTGKYWTTCTASDLPRPAGFVVFLNSSKYFSLSRYKVLISNFHLSGKTLAFMYLSKILIILKLLEIFVYSNNDDRWSLTS